MANVWDAMKKHQAEEEARKAQAQQESPDADSQASAAPASSPKKPAPEATVAAKPARKAHSRSRAGHAAPANGNGSEYSQLIRACHDPASSIAEEYRALRINLTSERSDGKLCFLITSAKAGEGKTVTCANLAVVLAERDDRKTIVVDGDVRKGSLSELFAKPREPGLADVLKGTASVKEAIRKTAYPNLFILPSGKAGKDQCGQLLVRPELEDMVNLLRREYDHVVFDSPPIGTNIPDAGMIGRAVGQAIVVVRMNKTRRESVEAAIRQLHSAKVEVSGLVLTHRTFTIPKFLYGGSGKGYDYYHHDYK